MIISMVVLIAACAVWVAMVPRVSTVPRSVQDVPGIAREVSAQQKWQVALPQGLSSDWVPTNVRLLRYDGKAPSWHAGYQAPSGKFVSLEQTKNGTDGWVKDQTGFRAETGQQISLAGVAWTKVENKDNDQRSLVRVEPLAGLDTVVTGKAGWAELQRFAGSLQAGR
ncbi:DUF4245 domain-containing protein [Luteipulveratus sp. YIM 133296]|uniref:DUF4245 domain-containing protein n=2 Tax=Luteipulveratus flavus TaxID=3031728 RepID=A0ABT6C5X9_9MICO|nr:DUF4245 domain-containing protein [Luteipulveratus sp. YIM 133296]MDF8264349.1 DUF4245 domain-containing protein [Luteipulveratus sp. YIM 133296]